MRTANRILLAVVLPVTLSTGCVEQQRPEECARHDAASKLLLEAERAHSRGDAGMALKAAKRGLHRLGRVRAPEDMVVLDDTGQKLAFAEDLADRGETVDAAALTVEVLRARLDDPGQSSRCR